MKRYLYNLLIVLSQFCNTILGGDPDETMSSRIGKGARRGNKFYIFFSRFLDIFEKNHCKEAIEEDEGKDAIFK